MENKICKQCKQNKTASEQNDYCEDCFAYIFFDEDEDEGEDEFQRCSDCDVHDACVDFGCAIKQGIIPNPYKVEDVKRNHNLKS